MQKDMVSYDALAAGLQVVWGVKASAAVWTLTSRTDGKLCVLWLRSLSRVARRFGRVWYSYFCTPGSLQ